MLSVKNEGVGRSAHEDVWALTACDGRDEFNFVAVLQRVLGILLLGHKLQIDGGGKRWFKFGVLHSIGQARTYRQFNSLLVDKNLQRFRHVQSSIQNVWLNRYDLFLPTLRWHRAWRAQLKNRDGTTR